MGMACNELSRWPFIRRVTSSHPAAHATLPSGDSSANSGRLYRRFAAISMRFGAWCLANVAATWLADPKIEPLESGISRAHPKHAALLVSRVRTPCWRCGLVQIASASMSLMRVRLRSCRIVPSWRSTDFEAPTYFGWISRSLPPLRRAIFSQASLSSARIWKPMKFTGNFCCLPFCISFILSSSSSFGMRRSLG